VTLIHCVCSRTKGIINPEKTRWWPKWCAWQFVLLVYIGFIVPYRVCFDDREGTGKEGGWYLFDFFVDLCLLIDVYMQMRKIRRDRVTNELITDYKHISGYYMKSWKLVDSYWIDLLTAMPIHTVLNIFVWMVYGAIADQFDGCIAAESELDDSYCAKFSEALDCDGEPRDLCKSKWNAGSGELPWTYTVAHYVRFVKLLRLLKFPELAAVFYNRLEGPIPSQICGYMSRQVSAHERPAILPAR
jgi:hypothetical protein